MKKNILFIMTDLSAAGGQKSLVNLLSQIDYTNYNVDLFLLNPGGIFMEHLPKEVSVLTLPQTYKDFILPFKKSLKRLFIQGNFKLVFNRIMFTLINHFSKSHSKGEQYSWRYLAKSIGRINKNYDAAIGFLEKTTIYFCVDKVSASKKIGWIHTDYDKFGMDPKFDIKYFNKLDKIITVSEECSSILRNRFPSQGNKIDVIYNVISPNIITRMANQEKGNLYEKRDGEVIVLSIGRLDYIKGFEMAIESCRKLIDMGFKIKWNIIGEGEEIGNLNKLIQELNLEKHFKLLGLKSNPYPYIHQADIYVQPSRFEGKSIAIDEAKILKKPIVVTNYNTAKDQITDGTNGLIAEMNSDSISQTIALLLENSELKNNIVKNLSYEKLGTEDEIYKFYNII